MHINTVDNSPEMPTDIRRAVELFESINADYKKKKLGYSDNAYMVVCDGYQVAYNWKGKYYIQYEIQFDNKMYAACRITTEFEHHMLLKLEASFKFWNEDYYFKGQS